jgi:hypothetical protein
LPHGRNENADAVTDYKAVHFTNAVGKRDIVFDAVAVTGSAQSLLRYKA